jgi:glucosamine kinase
MILIADSGSTKTDWVLLNDHKRSSYKTPGFNPYFTDSEKIYQSLSQKLIHEFDPGQVKQVFFYGAGCLEEDKTAVVNTALIRCFKNASVKVGHDMLAAARALLGNTSGFAAILGTGSNTCLYDGHSVQRNIDSLGYLLGDEGSGSYIGKKVVRDFMRGYLPPELHQKFEQEYNLSNPEIFDTLYNKPLPNKFLAGFCKFADIHKDHPYIQKIVEDAFHDFFTNLVCKYPGYEKYKFNCIGSVGYIFRDILTTVAASHGMKTGKIIHTPIENLVNYHLTYPDSR